MDPGFHRGDDKGQNDWNQSFQSTNWNPSAYSRDSFSFLS